MESFLRAFLESYESELPREEFDIMIQDAAECHRNEMVEFARWLEYNGKNQLPEHQVDSFFNRSAPD